MEALIHAFGIDARLIAIQVLNFVVLAGLLSYFLYKPVLKIVKEREDKIKQGLLDADSAKKALEGAEAEKKVVLSSAQSKAEEIEKRAESHAKEKASQIIEEANESVASRIKQTESRLTAMKEEAMRENEAEVAKVAILAAEEILRKS